MIETKAFKRTIKQTANYINVVCNLLSDRLILNKSHREQGEFH